MKKIAIIMAGGNGTRFWPMSRSKLPKQYLILDSKDTLLNETISRLNRFIDIENIFIISAYLQKDILEKTLPERFLRENILLEPIAKNTAPAVCASISYIKKIRGESIMGVFPADSYIKNEDLYTLSLLDAYSEAEKSNEIITLGIKPTFPSTGYGYLKVDEAITDKKSYKLSSFVEKPKLEIAKSYLESGQYFWNSGMFIFNSKTLLDNYKEFLPNIYHKSSLIDDWSKDLASGKINELYSSMQPISIDNGIMEKSQGILMLPLKSDWSDLGSWDSLDVVKLADKDGNIIEGNNIVLDTKDSIIISDDQLIATIGIDNLVIVQTNGAILVCDKNKVQDIKEVVNILKSQNSKLL